MLKQITPGEKMLIPLKIDASHISGYCHAVS